MKAFMKVTRHRFREKAGHVEPTEDLEEFKTGMKDIIDWRARYERVMRSSSNVSLRALDFASASQDLAKSLEDAFGSTLKRESPDIAAIFDKLGRIQMDIANLLQQYSSHVAQAITIPTETLLNELQKIEEEKIIYDEKRENFDQHRMRVAKLKPRNGGKAGEAGDEELQEAQDAYDEHAMALGCKLLTLEQKRPRSVFSQAAKFHSAQMKLFGAGLQAVKMLEVEIRGLVKKKNVDRHIYFMDDGYYGEGESESPTGTTGHAYDWEGEREHRSNVSSTPISPTAGELRDLPSELPTEWHYLLSSLDSRLAEMGERTLNKKDKVFAVNAIMAAASEVNKSKPGRGSLSWDPSNHHATTSQSHSSSLSKSAPLSSAGNSMVETHLSYENSPAIIPSVSGGPLSQRASPLPAQLAARQAPSKSWVASAGASSQPVSGPAGVALPAQPSSSGGSVLSMASGLPPPMSATLLGNSISGPLPPHGRSVTPPPGTAAAMPLPEPESVMERTMSHGNGVARGIGAGSRQVTQNGMGAASSRRLWQSGPLTLGGGKAPGTVPVPGVKRVTGFPLPTEGQVRSESPLRVRPHRSPPMSPPPVSVSEVHRLPLPPTDAVNSTNVSPSERPSSHVAHSAPLTGHHTPTGAAAVGPDIPVSVVVSGSGSASPLPPPPPVGSANRVWPSASAVIASQKGKEHVKSSRPSRSSSGQYVSFEEKDESMPLPTGNGNSAGSSRGASPNKHVAVAHRPRRSLSFGGAPGEEIVYNSESPTDASQLTRRHSGPLPPSSPPHTAWGPGRMPVWWSEYATTSFGGNFRMNHRSGVSLGFQNGPHSVLNRRIASCRS
eukprot:TRINITY_DN17251_c0_g1_i1.p1 TRINITY_DN17251_c0_g1~~TRINITY_DN17251_c0_g1_i1.p1  ORF type:complete len:836 (+),score=150.58 TRINITY_DN17251_c0_g1_i1:354-2861(+)